MVSSPYRLTKSWVGRVLLVWLGVPGSPHLAVGVEPPLEGRGRWGSRAVETRVELSSQGLLAWGSV